MWYSGSLLPRHHSAHSHKKKGSGVTSQNFWASLRSIERQIKLQSGVYMEIMWKHEQVPHWNNTLFRHSRYVKMSV